jgi:hypothetical protein
MNTDKHRLKKEKESVRVLSCFFSVFIPVHLWFQFPFNAKL